MRLDIRSAGRGLHAATNLLPTALAYLLVRVLAANQFSEHDAEGELRTILARPSLVFGFIIHARGLPYRHAKSNPWRRSGATVRSNLSTPSAGRLRRLARPGDRSRRPRQRLPRDGYRPSGIRSRRFQGRLRPTGSRPRHGISAAIDWPVQIDLYCSLAINHSSIHHGPGSCASQVALNWSIDRRYDLSNVHESGLFENLEYPLGPASRNAD